MELKPLQVSNPKISSKFGPRLDPKTKAKSFHSGVDFKVPTNTACIAVDDGKIVVSKANGGGLRSGYGYYLVVQHDGFYTIYGHLVKLGLPVGTVVKAGQEIGRTGNTGYSTGPHLHFEVRTGTYNSHSFVKNAAGMMPNAVDPETFQPAPLHERILKNAGVDMARWKAYIAKEANDETGKFLPDLIVKIFNSK
jgi:murein DD-endopeptidase MepM/ murein hydrolase activator NlpD